MVAEAFCSPKKVEADEATGRGLGMENIRDDRSRAPPGETAGPPMLIVKSCGGAHAMAELAYNYSIPRLRSSSAIGKLMLV
jgi:hypothetical protein